MRINVKHIMHTHTQCLEALAHESGAGGLAIFEDNPESKWWRISKQAKTYFCSRKEKHIHIHTQSQKQSMYINVISRVCFSWAHLHVDSHGMIACAQFLCDLVCFFFDARPLHLMLLALHDYSFAPPYKAGSQQTRAWEFLVQCGHQRFQEPWTNKHKQAHHSTCTGAWLNTKSIMGCLGECWREQPCPGIWECLSKLHFHLTKNHKVSPLHATGQGSNKSGKHMHTLAFPSAHFEYGLHVPVWTCFLMFLLRWKSNTTRQVHIFTQHQPGTLFSLCEAKMALTLLRSMWYPHMQGALHCSIEGQEMTRALKSATPAVWCRGATVSSARTGHSDP